MSIITDIGEIPLKYATDFFKKGYLSWIILGIIGFIIWLISQ